MHPARIRSFVVSSLALGLLITAPIAALAATDTRGQFYERRFTLPGVWTVIEDASEVLQLERRAGDGVSFFTLKKIPAEDCAYGVIRKTGLNAWGGGTLHQKDLRLLPITFTHTSRSGYTGYKWITPGLQKGMQHWCLGQAPKTAIEFIAPASDKDLLNYVERTLIYTFARRSRI